MKFGAARTRPVQIGPTLIGPARTDVAQVIIDAPSRGARPPVHRRPPVYLAQVTTAGARIGEEGLSRSWYPALATAARCSAAAEGDGSACRTLRIPTVPLRGAGQLGTKPLFGRGQASPQPNMGGLRGENHRAEGMLSWCDGRGAGALGEFRRCR